MEGKEFDSFISFKTCLDQYSNENNTVYCIADSRTAQYSNKRLPKDLKPFPTFPSLNIHMKSMFANISESKRRVRAKEFAITKG